MWYYNNKCIGCIDDFPDFEKAVGYVYLITCLSTGRKYIGRKNLYSTRKTKTLKKDLLYTKAGTVNKRSISKRITKESDWQKYWSSSAELKADVKLKGEANFKREVLEVVSSLRMLNYLEVKYQFQYNVLETDSYNDNILGKYFRKHLEG